MEYLFILGNASELAAEELRSVLKSSLKFKEIFSNQKVFHIETIADLDCTALIDKLGGTVKIAKVEAKINKDVNIVKTVTSILDTSTYSSNACLPDRQEARSLKSSSRPPEADPNNNKITFGLSWLSDNKNIDHFNDIYHYSREIKNILEQKGIKARFVLPKENKSELSSVVVEKQKIKEVIVAGSRGNFILGTTLAVQNFQQWRKRDYERPKVLPEEGMLPPKIARMMVNIGFGKLETVSGEKTTLLDPFCGMGTILAEGLLSGLTVFGSDNQKVAVESSRQNLEWLKKNFQFSQHNFQLFQEDAAHIFEKLEKNSIDLIVTEPYLGPMIEQVSGIRCQVLGDKNVQFITKNNKAVTPGYIKRIIDGLERMYLGCLKDWHKILTNDGVIVIALPSYLIHSQEFFVKKVVDNSYKLGYSIETGPLPYSREKAVVRRNIYVFRKITN
ncbi:MAG: methyltransferase domain-containing protein [Patescibacteria group bacterium]|nr:methyltransferase domain-containing protein [Patescibacteria group bacterium]